LALYLDIDLDYFVTPVLKESITNRRPAGNPASVVSDPGELLATLQGKGLQFGSKRYLFTNHMQSHLRWWINGKKDNTVIHIDAHSDLYGHSYPDLSRLKPLGCQNYLWHSIREGLISEIYWVFPDLLLDLGDSHLISRMFSPAQLGLVDFKDNILHVELNCTLLGGQAKKVSYHLLSAKHLPNFEDTAEIITVASSPEFIPRQADDRLLSIGKLLDFDEEIVQRVLTQHKEMNDS